MKVFIAQYDGSRCGYCDEQLWADEDSCVYLDDPDDGVLAHAECAEDNGHEVQWD